MKLYRKTYLCVCEGQQEELYLKHLASLLKRPRERIITFNTIIGQSTRLTKSYTEYDSVLLFDYDFDQKKFEDNIELCHNLYKQTNPSKRKKGKHIYHAFSNVNFDLWLILHKEDYYKPVTRNDAYISDVRRIYNLGAKSNIKNRDIIGKILSQITLDSVRILRAEKIRLGKLDSDSKKIGSCIYYSNPDFSIHNFLKIVLADCGEM